MPDHGDEQAERQCAEEPELSGCVFRLQRHVIPFLYFNHYGIQSDRNEVRLHVAGIAKAKKRRKPEGASPRQIGVGQETTNFSDGMQACKWHGACGWPRICMSFSRRVRLIVRRAMVSPVMSVALEPINGKPVDRCVG